MTQRLRPLVIAALVLSACHVPHLNAETIYQPRGDAKAPWTPASGESLQAPFWIRLDADVAGSRHIIPDFVANGISTMKLAFSYPDDARRVRGLDAIGCGADAARRSSPVPLRVRVYALGARTPTLISDTHETQSICEGWSRLDVDVILGELNGLVDGRHYAIVLDTLVRHPEFKAEGVGVYFLLSRSHHSK
ncbi:hypothetical protein Bsp3421_002566 [Burkholderia sp. FERM BP-3421]|jgi:hypothetical protein|uniref:hypothetical protein n=1 Tax=Burkholderia sp. FERM BP-3421 TaxID=1494466 RepID=UPI00235F14AB|nr:hypothetical protein [Burkholderia sp. FERM BP-3421]WDD92551.1 hypothetical protein Bsp3421_002566 [Burkholderia sp. FERM BP-3421]